MREQGLFFYFLICRGPHWLSSRAMLTLYVSNHPKIDLRNLKLSDLVRSQAGRAFRAYLDPRGLLVQEIKKKSRSMPDREDSRTVKDLFATAYNSLMSCYEFFFCETLFFKTASWVKQFFPSLTK
jgi:hypothetical protein